MSSFTKFSTELKLEPVTKKELFKLQLFRVTESFRYYVGSEDSGKYVEVPKNFRTDVASIPFGFRWLVPQLGSHGQACVVHDYLCDGGPLITEKEDKLRIHKVHKDVTRKEADKIFKEALEVLEVPWWRRTLMYYAVRAFAIVTGKDHAPYKYKVTIVKSKT